MKAMKIKSIIKSTALALVVGIFSTSCDVDTTTVMFEEDHNFTEPSDTVFSVLGMLNLLQNVGDRAVLLGEVRGDLISLDPLLRDESLRRLAEFDFGTDTTYNKYVDYYAIVNNCNFFLSRADSAMERQGEKVFMKEYAVVSGFRAWAYLQLVQNYGEIPFYTHPLLSYSEIEEVMNDKSNRKGMKEICDYFIEDLWPYVDIEYPNYKNFTYGEKAEIDCRYFFFPIRLLLGDFYLWRGACTNSKLHYALSAQCYRDFIVRNRNITRGNITLSDYVAGYKSGDFESRYNNWSSLFYNVGSSYNETFSIIPFAKDETYGKMSKYNDVLRKFYGSESLKNLVDSSYYCYVSDMPEYALMADTIYTGTPENPRYYSYITTPGEPMYTFGDLRLYQRSSTVKYDMPVDKFPRSNPHVTTYRLATVYLRLAEAINGAGFPLTAFAILKYGLSTGNLMYYDANGELDRLIKSGFSFFDMGDDEDETTIGIHSRGSGNAEMDTLHYSFPILSMENPTREDSIAAVELLICDELALETSFEGNRFYDLMRFSFRRGNSFLASKIARRDNPMLTDDELPTSPLYNKLLDENNWYLPMIE